MPKVFLTRRYKFSAAHRLHSETLSEEENRRVYGKCNNPAGHGHNYCLEVTVTGPVDPETGMCSDVEELDRVVKESVIEKLDHKHLNFEVEEFDGRVPTGENIVQVVWEILSKSLPHLYQLRLQETRDNFFEYRG
ncbi:6-carboxytetrahydropterin synthase [candidate division TA06 bacterium]|nr:6-carboxytetrahydropterin synthase [candidate division TA06 bacterium]